MQEYDTFNISSTIPFTKGDHMVEFFHTTFSLSCRAAKNVAGDIT